MTYRKTWLRGIDPPHGRRVSSQISVRTWDAGSGENKVLFAYMIFWAFFILLGIVRSNWEWNTGTILGLIFTACILISWITFFLRKPEVKTEFNDRCPRCSWQNIKQVGPVKDNIQQFKCFHCSNKWRIKQGER